MTICKDFDINADTFESKKEFCSALLHFIKKNSDDGSDRGNCHEEVMIFLN